MYVPSRKVGNRITAILAALWCVSILAAPALAQRGQPPKYPMQGKEIGPAQTPEQQKVIESVTFDQKLDSQVPLDATFRDEQGQTVTLGSLFRGKPVVLDLVYYECPMICNEILNGTLHSLKDIPFDAGKEFDVVAISIDHEETPALAAAKKAEYVRRYEREGGAAGWHFLTGDEDQIRRVADAVGFHYAYLPESGEYAHPSGIMVLTPTGHVSHYFFGVQYEPSDLRLGLVEASENKIGSPVDKILLLCYHYDPVTGKYGILAMTMIRFAGAFTVVAIVFFIILALRRERGATLKPEEPQLGTGG